MMPKKPPDIVVDPEEEEDCPEMELDKQAEEVGADLHGKKLLSPVVVKPPWEKEMMEIYDVPNKKIIYLMKN